MATRHPPGRSQENKGDFCVKLVFLLEEPSTKHLLDVLLPKILPEDVDFQTIPHNGKRDLQKSIPRKLRGWNEPGDVRFVIVHDQDDHDCIKLKQDLVALCEDTGKKFLVRIACQEMESWYFGDVSALAAAYDKPKLSKITAQKKYRIPDDITSPKEELRKLLPEHQQIEGAKRVAPYMDIENNTSVSFNQFVSGIRRFIQ
jgi:hypothetical protein